MIYMFYKENLKYLRERQGILQKELSNAINIAVTQYCNYENEVELMPIKHLNTICEFLNISLDYIFSFTDIKQYPNSSNKIDNILMSKRLKEFRKYNKLTQVKLATILNIGNGTIAGYETGKFIISTPSLYTICKKYGVSADYLLGKTDAPKYFH